MKRAIKTVNPETFEEYEQKVWRMECRQTKILAARTASWTAGTILFVLIFFGATFNAKELADLAGYSPFGALAPLWRDICVTIWPGFGAMERIVFVCLSMLGAVLIATAVHVVFAMVVRLIWVQPAKEFTPAGGSGSAQIQVLYQRFLAARQPSVRTRPVYLAMSAFYAAAVLLPALLNPEFSRSAAEALGGVFVLAAGFLVALAGCMLLFLSFYLLHRKLSVLLSGLGDEDALERGLRRYLEECKGREEHEEERREQAEQARRQRLQGDELYRQAIAEKPVDEDQIAAAADMGCRPACLYMGRQLMEAWSTSGYTADEKRELAEMAKEYFLTASLEEDVPESRIEAEFGYLTFVAVTESGDSAKWREILNKLRAVQDSGMLPEHYAGSCELLIRTVAEKVNKTDANQPRRDESHELPLCHL